MAFLLIGCLLYQARQVYPPGHIKNFTPEGPHEAYLEGIIVNEPQSERTSYGQPKTSFMMDAAGLKTRGIGRDVSGRVKVSVFGAAAPAYGDKVLLKGLLSRPRRPGNPGEFDYRRYLERNGVFSVFSAKSEDVVLLREGAGNPIVRAAYEVRGRIKALITSYLPRDNAGFLVAILLGLRQDLGDELNDIFMKTGTVHLLAISGLNVGLLVFLVMIIFRIARVPKRANIILTISLLVFYAILTNGSPSVIRATVMVIALLFGSLIGREMSLWNSLGLAAVIILGFDPNAFFDVGFRLSFLSLISILYITPKLEEAFGYDRKLAVPFTGKWRRYLWEGVFVSAAAWIGLLPLILFYFNIATPVSVISNLVAVPLSFLITASAVPFILFGHVIPFIANIFSASTSFLCDTLFAANEAFARVPLAYFYFPKPPLYLTAVYYLFLAAFIEHKRLKIPPAKLSAAALLVINMIIWHSALRPDDGRLRVTFLDVGHGDSVFVEFPRGGNMLIDGGMGGDRDTGRNIILPFLRNKGISVIDAVVLTHPDMDHVGGLIPVIKGMKVKEVFDNGTKTESGVYLAFKEAALKNKIRRRVLRRGDLIEGLRDISLICLNPSAEGLNDPSAGENDKSLALRIKYGRTAVLLCGDIGERPISEIISLTSLIKAEVLMLPHHGQELILTREALIDSVKPAYAVISQGDTLSEIARSRKAEELISAKGIKVFRTNRAGAICAVINGEGVLMGAFRDANEVSY
jgi:competence protein ComEC